MTTNLPELPTCGVAFPNSHLLTLAVEYTKKSLSPAAFNHSMRSAAYAMLCIKKLPQLANTDKELVVLACIFHDLGWSTHESIISKDKRFEVDGANAARSWIREHLDDLKWSERQIQLVWDAIALHATGSIAMHKEAEVAAVHCGILADFRGPNFPGGIVAVDEHQEIVRAFPRLGFRDEIVSILCGLCKQKPETTYDNFVSSFGLKFGLDGKGEGREEFAEKVEQSSPANLIMGALKATEEAYETQL